MRLYGKLCSKGKDGCRFWSRSRWRFLSAIKMRLHRIFNCDGGKLAAEEFALRRESQRKLDDTAHFERARKYLDNDPNVTKRINEFLTQSNKQESL